jgi:hypothetical protein
MTIAPIMNATYLTGTPASTYIPPNNTCNYLIKFPADAKAGDFISFRYNKAGNTEGYYTIANSYTTNAVNTSTSIKVSTTAASFTIYYP